LPPEAAGSAPPLSPNEGTVHTGSKSAGHRVFVDGKVIGQSPLSFPIRCGAHKIRVGSQGAERAVDVPCGGEVTVEP
jgi:hypothetical protein